MSGSELSCRLHIFAKKIQCCGSGSGIRWLFDPLDPGSGMGKKIKIRIRDEHPGSYFRELRNKFWLKILKLFDAVADPGSGNLFDPGSGINIPDPPQHCKNYYMINSYTKKHFF
jgi:hypothetical protein